MPGRARTSASIKIRRAQIIRLRSPAIRVAMSASLTHRFKVLTPLKRRVNDPFLQVLDSHGCVSFVCVEVVAARLALFIGGPSPGAVKWLVRRQVRLGVVSSWLHGIRLSPLHSFSPTRKEKETARRLSGWPQCPSTSMPDCAAVRDQRAPRARSVTDVDDSLDASQSPAHSR